MPTEMLRVQIRTTVDQRLGDLIDYLWALDMDDRICHAGATIEITMPVRVPGPGQVLEGISIPPTITVTPSPTDSAPGRAVEQDHSGSDPTGAPTTGDR